MRIRGIQRLANLASARTANERRVQSIEFTQRHCPRQRLLTQVQGKRWNKTHDLLLLKFHDILRSTKHQSATGRHDNNPKDFQKGENEVCGQSLLHITLRRFQYCFHRLRFGLTPLSR